MNKKDNTIQLLSLEELLLQDYERLTELIDIYSRQIKDNKDNDKESDDSSANALVRLLNQREKVLEKYYMVVPDSESTLSQFKRQSAKYIDKISDRQEDEE